MDLSTGFSVLPTGYLGYLGFFMQSFNPHIAAVALHSFKRSYYSRYSVLC